METDITITGNNTSNRENHEHASMPSMDLHSQSVFEGSKAIHALHCPVTDKYATAEINKKKLIQYS